MNRTSQIVYGGGWKETRIEKVKVKAWSLLFLAIGLGGVAVLRSDSPWLYSLIPAGISFSFSVGLFFREKPWVITLPSRRMGEDLRKLYGTSGQKKQGNEKRDG